MMKCLVTIGLMTLAATATSQANDVHLNTSRDPFSTLRDDKCLQQVVAVANGLAAMWKNSKVALAELDLDDENRTYGVVIDLNGSIENYQLVLANDSAYSCIFLEMRLTESGA